MLPGRIIRHIEEERARQDAMWGVQRHDWNTWLTILGEEYGEACDAALRAQFGNGNTHHLRNELIQTAAVAIAAVEHIDKIQTPKNTVYLAGPIAGCTVEECTAWRRDLAARLQSIGFKVLDPTRNIEEKCEMLTTGHGFDIVEQDLDDINNANVVIAYCPFPSVGTSMEIIYARRFLDRDVYVVGDFKKLSPWVLRHATRVFIDFDELVDWLAEEVEQLENPASR